jgi:fatty acid desaturase
MFKDIRVRAALRTLAVFVMAAVSGFAMVLALETYGFRAVMTLCSVIVVIWVGSIIYKFMLLELEHEEAAEDYRAQLEKSTTE